MSRWLIIVSVLNNHRAINKVIRDKDTDKVYDYPTKNVDVKIEYPGLYDFKKSRCRTMTVQEHYRWSSYMISQGIIPSTID